MILLLVFVVRGGGFCEYVWLLTSASSLRVLLKAEKYLEVGRLIFRRWRRTLSLFLDFWAEVFPLSLLCQTSSGVREDSGEIPLRYVAQGVAVPQIGGLKLVIHLSYFLSTNCRFSTLPPPTFHRLLSSQVFPELSSQSYQL